MVVAPVGVGGCVVVGVGVGVGMSSRTGRSVRCTGGLVTGVAGGTLAAGAVVGTVGRYSGAVVVVSLWPNGFTSTSTINATGTTIIASAVVRRVPPYLPIGPRTGRPCWSTQNAHRCGGAGHDFGGCQRRGGRQSALGGDGHSGGVLNCLTSILPLSSLSTTHRERTRTHRIPWFHTFVLPGELSLVDRLRQVV
jgi:hypothetical protein